MSVGADIYVRLRAEVDTGERLGVHDKEVSVRSVIATVMWVVGIALVVANIFVEPDVGEVGLTCVAAAMVMNVRGYFCQFHEQVRNGFDLGRDYERGRARVHQLR